MLNINTSLTLLTILIFNFFFSRQIDAASQPTTFETHFQDIPVSYKGRFRPMEAYARLWLYDLYHRETIKKSQLLEFKSTNGSALEFLWKLNFFGSKPLLNSPLFWVHLASLKQHLDLNLNQDRFSYNDLYQALFANPSTGVEVARRLIPYYFFKSYFEASNKGKNSKIELTQLSPGLWILLKDNTLSILSRPNVSPWKFLQPLDVLLNQENLSNYNFNRDKQIVEDIQTLMLNLNQFAMITGSQTDSDRALVNSFNSLRDEGLSYSEIDLRLEAMHPLQTRLMQASTLIKALPGKFHPGEWYPLESLHVKVYNPRNGQLELVGNFTLYPDDIFKEIRSSYFALENAFANGSTKDIETLSALLAEKLKAGYSHIAGKPYIETAGKALHYPSESQLHAESMYMRLPFIEICIALYSIAIIALLFSAFYNRSSLYAASIALFLCAFLLHTFVLALRVYIMGRPPVSNMFETVIYVPWIAALLSLLLQLKSRNVYLLLASSLVSVALLVLLQISHLNANLENVQAVLDSQYWLIIHVLMVVGSYGVFLFSGMLGHFYLGGLAWKKKETGELKLIAKVILHSMYLGLLLLIPGTVLGGVWAAESWGRFWDWDPKESWAFISICVYLIWVHAYRFNRIGNLGLAIGSITGLLAISFTWYGVNYILGTGFHSYGFGSGGETYYYLYIIAELVFLTCMLLAIRKVPQEAG